jgi:hypothetical protein
VAAPGRRPSLIGAGIDPEKIENTWEQAKNVLLNYRHAEFPFRRAAFEPRSEGLCEICVNYARWILPSIVQVR